MGKIAGALRQPGRALSHLMWRTGLDRKLNRLVWNAVSSGPEFEYLHRDSRLVFEGIPAEFEDAEFNAMVIRESKRWSRQEEHVLLMRDVLLEPERSIGLLPGRRIAEPTRTNTDHFPDLARYLGRSKSPEVVDEAVLYDGAASTNYHHHFVDALNNLAVLRRRPLPPSLPFIVNRTVFESPFFQHLYRTSADFAAINWLVQEPGQWLHVNKLIRLRSFHHVRETWVDALAFYPKPPGQERRRIFLSRDKSRYNRCLVNEAEVIALLGKYGFETVYAENLTLDQQREMLQGTEYLVALHGAGLVQQVFMEHERAHVMEIMPSDYLIPLYYWQAYALGIRYFDVVIGGRLDAQKNYRLDLDLLERALQRMFSAPPDARTYGLHSDPGVA